MAAVFFACCSRGRIKRRRPLYDERVAPDEESRLIPTTEEPALVVSDAVAEELERRKERLTMIVRAKQGNMINTFAYGLLNNRYSPQLFGANGSGSRSASRDPYSQGHRYGYGTGGGTHNPTLAHTMSMPSPLEPEQSEIQVHISSAAEGTTSVERSDSRRRETEVNMTGDTSSSTGNVNPTGKRDIRRGSGSHPSFLGPSLIISPSTSPSSVAKSVSPSRGSNSDSNSNSNFGDIRTLPRKSGGEGLGVRLVRPLPLSPSSAVPSGLNGNTGRRGRPKVKGILPSPTGSGYTSASSNSTDGAAVKGRQSFSEQTPRPLNLNCYSTPSIVTAPPPSPHSDEETHLFHGGDVSKTEKEIPPPPIFEIKDVGKLTIDWDD